MRGPRSWAFVITTAGGRAAYGHFMQQRHHPFSPGVPGRAGSESGSAITALARGLLREDDPQVVMPLLERAYLGGLREWVRAQLTKRGCPSADLDDLVQEVFRRVLLSRTRYRGSTEGEFWAYLSGITRSVLGHEWRRRARRATPAPDDVLGQQSTCLRTGRGPTAPMNSHSDESPEQRAGSGDFDLTGVLEEGLHDLTPAQQTVILLRYRSGLSLRAVAEALGRAPSTVAETEKAALARLERRLSNRAAEARETDPSATPRRPLPPVTIRPRMPSPNRATADSPASSVG